MNAQPDLIPGLAPDLTAIRTAERTILDIVEELGAAIVHLREGREALDQQNVHAARSDLEDASDAFGTIERLASLAGAATARLEDHMAGALDRAEVLAGQSQPYGAVIPTHDSE